MHLRMPIIAGLASALIGLASYSASAVPLAHNPLAAAAGESRPVETVQWGYCPAVRQRCALRWGWRTWRYFRCAGRRGCA